MNYFLKTPANNQIQIGSKVRIKKKENIFRKTNPVFSSIWTEEIYEVIKIKKEVFPKIFYVNGLNKGFYSFHLQLISSSEPVLNTPLTEKIHIIGIEHENSF